jgi:hypothetical protein
MCVEGVIELAELCARVCGEGCGCVVEICLKNVDTSNYEWVALVVDV